jgi:hypothetical protein
MDRDTSEHRDTGERGDTGARGDALSDVLLLHAVQAWCDECRGERILVPVVDELPGGFCCTVCDTAVFAALDDLPTVAPLRRSA